jgi:hypothetical protein
VLTESDWGGYRLLSCSHSQISLYDAGLRPIDNQTIGASIFGYSYGIYQISGPELIFELLSSPTPGIANSYPYIGTLGITEIMYWPYPGDYAYIIIENFINDTQNLFFKGDNKNPPYPKIGYSLNADIDYEFPPNTQLGPYRKLVVTEADPQIFRQKYNVPPWVQVFGPWLGAFNFSIEKSRRVKLSVPVYINSQGNGDEYNIESIRPGVYLPWPPGAAATGNSLIRKYRNIYGGEPTNWYPSDKSIIYQTPPNDQWTQPVILLPPKAPKRTSKPSPLALFGPDQYRYYLLNPQTRSVHYLLIGLASIICFICFGLALSYQIYRTLPKSTQSGDKD